MKYLVLFISLLMFAISSSAVAQDSGDTIRLITLLDPGNFIPVFQVNSVITRLSWEALYRVDGETGLPTPGLGLTSWEISEDGLTYTFTIRDDAFWSDGEPITTTDIQYTLETISSDDVISWLNNYLPPELFNNFAVVNDKVFTIRLEN